MREVVLDTETTGLNPRSGDRIVEIGCVALNNHIPSGETFQHYIDPERDMPEEAARIHGLTGEFLAGKPKFADIVDEFLAYIGTDKLVIHNAAFDLGFLNAELARLDRDPIPMSRAIDTVSMARRKFPGAPASLDALCRRFSIDNSQRTKHGALLDAELLAEVYLELIGGAQPHLTLISKDAPQQGKTTHSREYGARPTPLKPRVTDEEIKAHNNFILELGEDVIWKKSS